MLFAFLFCCFLQYSWYQTNLSRQFVCTLPKSACISIFFYPPAVGRAGAVYPLSSSTRGKDVSTNGNPPGRRGYVRNTRGPDGVPGTATYFYGRANSYIQFPNRGRLDTRRSITLLAWIKHLGRAGPIFNYMPNGWGVHFWMVTPRTLFARFTRRRGRRSTSALTSRTVRYRTWEYVGAEYDYGTGIARLFVRNRFVASRRIGRIRLATNYPVRMGARIRDRRYFRGSISCLQVYKKALTAGQILARRTRCFKKGIAFSFLRYSCIQCMLLSFFVFVCPFPVVCIKEVTKKAYQYNIVTFDIGILYAFVRLSGSVLLKNKTT